MDGQRNKRINKTQYSINHNSLRNSDKGPSYNKLYNGLKIANSLGCWRSLVPGSSDLMSKSGYSIFWQKQS